MKYAFKIKTILSNIYNRNPKLKKLMAILIFSIPLYFILSYFEILTDYLYVLEFLLVRLILVFLFLMLLQILLDLPITKCFQKELQMFNLDPKDKPFVVLLRRVHFQLFLIGYISFSLATTYLVENFMILYVLGIVTFISASLYLVQFIVYTTNYVQRETKNFTYTGRRYVSTSMFPTGQTLKKIGVVCLECAKVGVQLGLGVEAGWKLTHGGMNDMSPWRQFAMNKMFPDDQTKIWTETKAGMAMHNRARGYPHDDTYKTGESLNNVRKSISQLPKGKK